MKPILFNTEMVKAILEDRKTVTRRTVKPKSKNACSFKVVTRKSDGAFMGVYDCDEDERMFESSQTPPCAVGDILYVRETWNICNMDAEQPQITFIYKASESESESANTVQITQEVYDKYADRMAENNPEWRPSLHMPKEAARLFLRVKSICVERLQDITPEQALCEGTKEQFPPLAIDEFRDIWNTTIKPSELDTYGWNANPFVWVIEFERLPCSSIEEAEQLEQVQQLHRQTSFDEDVIGCYKSNYMKEGICEAAKSGWCKDLTKCQILEKVESGKGEGCVAGEML